MPKGIERTPQQNQTRRLEIAHAAADLIFRQGFAESSVSQIAAAAGIGKSTLYDFFKTKDEIILLLLEEPLAEIIRAAQQIVNDTGSVVDQIEQILHMHLGVLLRDRAFILKLSFESQRLPLRVQAQHEVKRQVYQDLIVELIKTGIADGSLRDIDADMLMKMLLTTLMTVVATARPVGTPREMLDKALNIVLRGALEE